MPKTDLLLLGKSKLAELYCTVQKSFWPWFWTVRLLKSTALSCTIGYELVPACSVYFEIHLSFAWSMQHAACVGEWTVVRIFMLCQAFIFSRCPFHDLGVKLAPNWSVIWNSWTNFLVSRFKISRFTFFKMFHENHMPYTIVHSA